MSPTLLMLAVLSVGQPLPAGGNPPGAPPGLFAAPLPLPAVPNPLTDPPPGVARVGRPQLIAADPSAAPATEKPLEPLNVGVQVPAAAKAPDAPPSSPATVPDRWLFMRSVQGTWLGALLDDNRSSVSGWLEMSQTQSSTDVTNQPVVWNDRANKFLFQQGWVRFDRAVVTTGTTDITYGGRLDVNAGSDYRFSLMRGLLNSQLQNSRGDQNLYGVDLIQFYGNMYIPTLFAGTDIRAGRLFTPWGSESLEGINTPFVSRSYAFNWSPPFTHMGIMVSPTFNAEWSAKFMLANGNDVFFDPAQEARAVGAITYTNPNKRDVVTFGYTIGRGTFNSGDTFSPTTAGEQSEPAGRNNINVFDLVWTRVLTSRSNYGLELIYGYQSNVPANIPGGIVNENKTDGTAHWGSVVQYLSYNFTPKLVGQTRLEFFDDFEGQRTGFEGLYTSITVGARYSPVKSVLIRPEIRYDYNNYTKPFEGRNDIVVGSLTVDFRY